MRYPRSLQHARLTDALLRLRLSVPPKNSVGPDALGVPGPCFAARETSENLQMISRRRKRLAFAPAASDVRFGDCVKRTSALALMELRIRISRRGGGSARCSGSRAPLCAEIPVEPCCRLQHFQCPTPSHFSPNAPRATRRGNEHVADRSLGCLTIPKAPTLRVRGAAT
jgi:hypothetical protein